jgi:hypothetical protein
MLSERTNRIESDFCVNETRRRIFVMFDFACVVDVVLFDHTVLYCDARAVDSVL